MISSTPTVTQPQPVATRQMSPVAQVTPSTSSSMMMMNSQQQLANENRGESSSSEEEQVMRLRGGGCCTGFLSLLLRFGGLYWGLLEASAAGGERGQWRAA
ncbi:hypothetical protein JCM5350_002423 [Sporobolomyces pararoseus]